MLWLATQRKDDPTSVAAIHPSFLVAQVRFLSYVEHRIVNPSYLPWPSVLHFSVLSFRGRETERGPSREKPRQRAPLLASGSSGFCLAG